MLTITVTIDLKIPRNWREIHSILLRYNRAVEKKKIKYKVDLHWLELCLGVRTSTRTIIMYLYKPRNCRQIHSISLPPNKEKKIVKSSRFASENFAWECACWLELSSWTCRGSRTDARSTTSHYVIEPLTKIKNNKKSSCTDKNYARECVYWLELSPCTCSDPGTDATYTASPYLVGEKIKKIKTNRPLRVRTMLRSMHGE